MKFFKTLGLSYLAIVTPLIGAENKTTSAQEALQLKRITEYWKEKDFKSAKGKIQEFLAAYSESPMRDHLYAMLGDVWFIEDQFEEALDAYQKIGAPSFAQKTHYNKLQCLFSAKRYDEAIALGKELVKQDSSHVDQIRLLLAESLYAKGSAETNNEQKKELFKQAKEVYFKLNTAQIADKCVAQLANIHEALGEYAKAAPLYIVLADKFPEQREACLFQSAMLQSHYDKPGAAATFGKIYSLKGKFASKAAYNQLLLFFQAERYRDLLLSHEHAAPYIEEAKAPLIHYYVGKSLFAIGDYAKAVKPLTTYLEACSTFPKEIKDALFTILICAKETDDSALFDRILSTFSRNYSQDPDYAKALLTHAEWCKSHGKMDAAAADLKKLLDQFSEHEQKERVLFEYARIHYQIKNWEEASDAFSALITHYPKSGLAKSSWRYLLNASIQEVKCASATTLKLKQERFAAVLSSILEKEKIFSDAERKQYQMLLAKTLYDLDENESAIETLTEFLKENKEKNVAADAHFLMALCYARTNNDPLLFILHGEKALSLNPDLPNTSLLHQKLYNTYLNLAANESDEVKEGYLEKAAAHLYEVQLCSQEPLKFENQLWLADFHYQKALDDKVESREIAIQLFQGILGYPQNRTFSANLEPESLETMVLKLANLYDRKGIAADKVKILETLIERQQNEPEAEWKYARAVIFKLAQGYEEIGAREKALRTYELLQRTSTAPTKAGLTAVLHAARLKYAMLATSGEQERDESLKTILEPLKDLHLSRNLATEPVHMEAALDYADIKSSLESPEQKNDRKLFLLTCLKENLNNNHDPVTKQYLADKEKFAEQFHQYLSYLKLLDAEIFCLEAEGAKQDQEFAEADELQNKAIALLQQIIDEDKSATPYLIEHAKTSMEAMRATR